MANPVKTVLVTGGAGYIGSHTVLELLDSGYKVLVLDNLSNGSVEPLNRLQNIIGKSPEFIEGDIRDNILLDHVFSEFKIDAVIHFAGLKSVAESIESPLEYFDTNVAGTITLCRSLARANVRQLIFSSSATVYGEPLKAPCREDLPKGNPSNVYGRTKQMVEDLLIDLANSDARWSIAILRYFNPAGAHESGLIGEDPRGVPNNLIPYVSQVAVGRLEELFIYGDDFPTPDGSGIRDYIHVVDLAKGHLVAMQVMSKVTGVKVWNLGTGHGVSVFEIVRLFERVSGKPIPYKVVDRRPGDIAANWADTTKAAKELNWHAKKGLETLIEDTWRWQSKNPNGYHIE